MRAVGVTFRCRNLNKMKRFYTQILGWDVSEAGNNFCYLEAGDFTLGLLATRPKDWDYPTGSATFLDVRIEDPVTLRSRLAVKGVEVLKEEVTDGALFLHVEDPEGNIVSFFKASDN